MFDELFNLIRIQSKFEPELRRWARSDGFIEATAKHEGTDIEVGISLDHVHDRFGWTHPETHDRYDDAYLAFAKANHIPVFLAECDGVPTSFMGILTESGESSFLQFQRFLFEESFEFVSESKCYKVANPNATLRNAQLPDMDDQGVCQLEYQRMSAPAAWEPRIKADSRAITDRGLDYLRLGQKHVVEVRPSTTSCNCCDWAVLNTDRNYYQFTAMATGIGLQRKLQDLLMKFSLDQASAILQHEHRLSPEQVGIILASIQEKATQNLVKSKVFKSINQKDLKAN